MNKSGLIIFVLMVALSHASPQSRDDKSDNNSLLAKIDAKSDNSDNSFQNDTNLIDDAIPPLITSEQDNEKKPEVITPSDKTVVNIMIIVGVLVAICVIILCTVCFVAMFTTFFDAILLDCCMKKKKSSSQVSSKTKLVSVVAQK